jgi:hypothetical protein
MIKKARECTRIERAANPARLRTFREGRRWCHVHFQDHPASAIGSAMRMTTGCGSLSIGEQTQRKHGAGDPQGMSGGESRAACLMSRTHCFAQNPSILGIA